MASLLKDGTSRQDTSTCPLCGEPNHCAMAADPNARTCWCDEVEIPHSLLEKISQHAIRRACVCQKCIDDYHKAVD